MYQTDHVSIDQLEFHIDLGQRSFIRMLAGSTHHNVSPFIKSIVQGNCRLHAQVGDANNSSLSECHFNVKGSAKQMVAICNAVGNYVLLTSTGCDLKVNNLSNLCVNTLTVFGNPLIDINCGRCQKNDTEVAFRNTKAYARSAFEDHLNEEDLEVFSNGWNCGNGIWCEECEAGYYLPDCTQICERGYYGQNCLKKCTEVDIPNEYHCKGDETDLCDPRTGDITGCSDGCQTWYEGSDGLCQFYIRNVSWNNYKLEVKRVGSNWVLMTFKIPKTINKDVERFYRYYVECREVNNVEWNVHPTLPKELIHNAKKCQLFVKVSDLKKDAKYDLRICLSYEHQGHRQMAALDGNRYSTITTNCIKPPNVRCTAKACQLTWNLHQTLPDCQPMIVARILYQFLGDEEWVHNEVAVDQREFNINNLQYGIFRAKIIGSIGESGNIKVESDIAEIKITGIFASLNSWKFNYTSVVVLVGMLLTISLIWVFFYYCYRKKTDNGRKRNEQQQSHLNDYFNTRIRQSEHYDYAQPSGSASGFVPAVGTGTKTFKKQNTLGGNVNEPMSSEYMNQAFTDVSNDTYCQLNIQDSSC